MDNGFGLYYVRLGNGPRSLLAFHGIGQTGEGCFRPFADALERHYTIYAFDLFFHGRSSEAVREGFVLTPPAWRDYLEAFLREKNIERFDIAGFSLGGRFALATLEGFATRVDNAYLIAPDGITEHPLYILATRYPVFRRLFRWSLAHQSPLFAIAGVFQKAGVLHPGVIRFVRHVVGTPESAATVYRSWVSFRKLRPDLPALAAEIRKANVTLVFFTGRYDRMIRPRQLQPLAELLPSAELVELNCGHTAVVAETACYLREKWDS